METNIIKNWLKEKGKLHFTLIDPDKQSSEKAAKLANLCESFGTDAIMVGGSTIDQEITDKTTKEVKDSVKIPIILFPNSSNAISRFADYIFFMSMLNSKDRRFLIEEQLKGAPFIAKSKIKPIPLGYIVISTSKIPTTVERVGNPDKIFEKDVEKAVAYALAAKYFGFHCVYLEAGSGAEKPVPVEMVKEVKKNLDIPLIVGGGIRTPEAAKEIIKAGADVIVTGTIIERDPEIQKKIINTVKGR